MSEKRDIEIAWLINQTRENIKRSDLKEHLLNDTSIQYRAVDNYKVEIWIFTPFLINYCNELLPYVKNIKTGIKDIIEETHIWAIYLLTSQIFETWKSFFHLVNWWYSTALGMQLRNIQEADMLIALFMVEFLEDENVHLMKWFSGKIITHGEGRKRVGAFYSKADSSFMDIKEISSYIYEIESLGIHNAYISVLQLVNPFIEDFDFERYTQIYRTLSEVKHALHIMSQTNITLKAIYHHILKYHTKYIELDNILKKYSPEVTGQSANDFMKNFKWKE